MRAIFHTDRSLSHDIAHDFAATMTLNCLIIAILLLAYSGRTFANDNESLTEESLEVLLSKEVKTASKIAQQISDSPSAVSIVTAKDIKAYGYRTLAEVISSMRGLNVSSDHVYTYMSGRGFGRPGDYPGRVMLLIDGHQANDNIYNASYLGHDGLLDTELIDRVEYVSGPGSVVYGNGAFYGIINVITKKGAHYDGGQLALDGYSHQGYKARVTYGNVLDNGADILVSASGFNQQGEDWYFSEFNQPSNNFGRARHLDQEQNKRLFFKAQYQQWWLETAYVDRKKDDPGAGYGSDFNVKPNNYRDTNAYINLRHESDWSQTLKHAAKFYYGQYMYASDNVFSAEPYHEENTGRWWGVESKFVYTGFADHQLVYGWEYRNDYQLDLYLPEDTIAHSTYMASAYVQDEYRLNPEWSFNLGLRADYGASDMKNLSPRIAAIYSPTPVWDIKASYATAFRRPNVYEKYYADGVSQLASPDIKKEQVKAYELVAEYKPDTATKLLGSAYIYKAQNVIEVNEVAGLPGFIQAVNEDSHHHSRGFDIEYEQKLKNAARIRGNYAWQYATHEGNQRIVNMPKHLAKINYTQSLLSPNFNMGIELQYVGERLTERATYLPSYTIANLTMVHSHIAKDTSLSISIKNLFNRDYAVAAPAYYRQERFDQDGTNLWIQLSHDFK